MTPSGSKTLEFQRALKRILEFEGGKVDNPNDPGGRTAYGIIQRTYDGWRVAKGLAPQDVWTITQGEVEDIYCHRFWERGKANMMPWPLSLLHFDACVNHGTEAKDPTGRRKVNAGKLLQQALRMTSDEQDGIVGAATLRVISFISLKELCLRYLCVRFFRYDALVDANPRLLKFFTGGWEDRLEKLYAEI